MSELLLIIPTRRLIYLKDLLVIDGNMHTFKILKSKKIEETMNSNEVLMKSSALLVEIEFVLLCILVVDHLQSTDEMYIRKQI